MNIKPDVSLATHTTFQLGGPARLFCSVAKEEEIIEAVNFARHNEAPIFVLGKGSNLLVSDAGFPGLVIKNEIMGIDFGPEENGFITVTAGAGENWDDFVDETVSRNLHGVENLSAIPGSVGAGPVQNIGAYGMEISDTLVSVRALDTTTMKFVNLSNAECKFGYRDSVFKHEKSRYIITHVTLKLQKNGAVNITYRDLKEFFKNSTQTPTIKEVRDAVIKIRMNKLPDWTHWGTAGSFFKNPVISAEHFAELKDKYPELPGYPEKNGKVKVALGWILENICDAKGLCLDNVCTYEKQALVIVAQPGATAAGVVNLSQELMKRVKEKTGIDVEGEVEWVC